MKNRPQHFFQRSAWLANPAGSRGYRHWLLDRGSLTQRLRAKSAAFGVEGVHQKWARPQPDEACLLGLPPRQHALLREVRLCCNQQMVVFAHSVLPRRSLRGAWHGLERLGARPLGEALFNNPAVVRTSMRYRKLSAANPLFRRALAGMANAPSHLWARRSVFMLRGASILVTEVFLPGVLTL